MADLTGAQIDTLTKALSGAVSLFELEVSVHVATGDQLYDVYVGRNEPLRPLIRTLLLALQRDGTLAAFLAEVLRRKPARDDLRTLVLDLMPAVANQPDDAGPDLSLQTRGAVVPQAPPHARAPGLQGNVRPKLAMIDVRLWRERGMAAETRVCRVEIGLDAAGTGFLVGPQAVLTNWHVVRQVLEAGASAPPITCRFDYVRLPGGVRQSGETAAVIPNGVVDFSPCSAAELTADPEMPPPVPAELDHALLMLDKPLGRARGWITLPDAPLPLDPGAALMILQHPDGAPMTMAIDTDAVIGPAAGNLRLRYHTNTARGSSGSPCFNMDWALVALHHLGDPAYGSPRFNQGIPAHLIRARLVANGFGAALSDAGGG